MSKFTMDVALREKAGKGVARSLRREGRIPAVIYGGNEAPVMISLDAKEINLMYNRGHMGTSIGNLNADGKKHMVIARDIALHPVTDVVEHVDFLRVSEKTRINVAVPITVVGDDQSPALSAGAIITFARHDLDVECQATKIPDAIEVDISGLEVGSIVHARDIKLPAGVSLYGDIADRSILTLELPKKLSADLDDSTPAAEGEEAAEGDAAQAAEGEATAAEGEEKSAE